MDPKDFDTRIEELLAPKRCPDWGTKLQFFAEDFWTARRDAFKQDMLPSYLKRFKQLLAESHAFTLVTHTIPEFRSSVVGDLNKHQHAILDAIDTMRTEHGRLRSMTQDYFDSVAYKAEKDIAQDADLHRAAILLCGTGNPNIDQERAIRAWLAQAPFRRMPDTTKGVDDP